MAMVRIWQKKQIVIDPLTFRQVQMLKIGTVGVAAVKNRVQAAKGPEDGPAKPLTRNYAIHKSRSHLSNRRDLTYTGDMLRSFQVRTVSDNRAKAAVTGRGSFKQGWNKKRTQRVGVTNRIKAWANQQRQAWMVFSPQNRAAVLESARRILREIVPGLVKSKTNA